MKSFNKALSIYITIIFLVQVCVLQPAYSLAPRHEVIPERALEAWRDFTRDLKLGTEKFPLPPCLHGTFHSDKEDRKEVLPEEFPPLPFPNYEADVGIHDPYWLKIYITGMTLLDACKFQGDSVTFKTLRSKVRDKFKDYGRTFSNREFRRILNNLRRLNIVKSDNELDFISNDNRNVILNIPPRMLAVWADATEFIADDIRNAIRDGKLKNTLEYYAKICDKCEMYPVEANYPVLRAVVTLEEEYQSRIKDMVYEMYDSSQSKPPLIDSIFLILDYDNAKNEWLEKHASDLAGRRIYSVAAEISLLAGGLGRVMQYHGAGLKKLGADVNYIEPYYELDKNGQPIDYNKLPVAIRDLKEITNRFHILVQDKDVNFKVLTGVNEHNIRVYLIKPDNSYYAKQLYVYKSGEHNDYISAFEFTEFFAKATLELIRYLEKERRREEGANWKAPIVDANDGQVAAISAFAQVFYRDAGSIRGHETEPPKDAEETAEIFRQTLFSCTTHTYRNRVIDAGDFEEGREFLRRAGFKGNNEKYLWLFLCKHGDRLTWDYTSAGLRAADIAKGVSAIHAYEVSLFDPGVALYGITNGDNIEYSTEYFKKYMEEVGLSKSKYPFLSPDEIALVKKHAKSQIGLNPDQLVVSYSGRLVEEKAGRQRAFTDQNIENMVKAGIQVIIYGNVQKYLESESLGYQLIQLEARLREKGYPGKFIFRPSFSIDDQRKLLSATDIQIQDSDRFTGASEYTEADVSANGGLQFSPPYWEGIINKQGVAVDWNRFTGNTIVPENDTPEAYLAAIINTHKVFETQKNNFLKLQKNSLMLSRVLDSSLTSAAYARCWNRALQNKRTVIKERNLEGIKAVSGSNISFHDPISGEEISRQRLQQGVPENVVIKVKVDLTAHGYGRGRTAGIIDYNLVKVRIKDMSGRIIPLKFDGLDGGENKFARFEANLKDLPINGYVEVSSGLWWERTPGSSIKIIKTGSKEGRMPKQIEGNIILTQVSPQKNPLSSNSEIRLNKGDVAIFQAEFPCDEKYKDQLVPVLIANILSDGTKEIDWDDLGEDQLLISDRQYCDGKVVWTFGFVPKRDMEFTLYITSKDVPSRDKRIYFNEKDKNIKIKLIGSGELPKEIDKDLAYSNLIKMLNEVFNTKKNTRVKLLSPAELQKIDEKEIKEKFAVLAKIKDPVEVSALLYLIGQLVEKTFSQETAQDTKAAIILATAVNILKQWNGLAFSKIALLWDNLSDKGYAGYIGEIADILKGMEDEDNTTFSPQKQMLLYFLHAFVYAPDFDKISRYKGIDYSRSPDSSYPDVIKLMRENLLQTQMGKLARENVFTGVIVQDLSDFGAGINNWLKAINNFKTRIEGVQMVYLLEGLSAEDRLRLIEMAPHGVTFAERIEDIAGENIVYVTRNIGQKKDYCRGRGIKLVERGNCGPVIELSLALKLLSVKKFYEGTGISSEVLDICAVWLNEMQALSLIDEKTYKECIRDMNQLGYIKLPEIKKFEDMWKHDLLLPMEVSA